MTHLLRGRVLSFDAPDQPVFFEDGAVLTRNGLITGVGHYGDLQTGGIPETDHRPCLILPGFIDPHLHFPQVQVVASWASQLLDWLNDYTFPAEAEYADPAHAARMAGAFCDRLIANGTTTVSAYGSVHAASARALFSEALRRNMRIAAGKVMMDRNAPPGVLDSPQQGYDDTKALIAEFHGKGRLDYVITPRFAITSTPAQMEATQALVTEHPDLLVQTHLSENLDEIDLTLRLYPEARDYLDVYDRYGLLGPRTLMGHCIHLSDREIARMAETGTRAIACPTSNLFLGSGLFDRQRLEDAGVVTGIATDIGGGTSWSMLATLNEGYKVLQLQRQKLHPYALFHWATAGNAAAMGLQDRIGRIALGMEADLVVLDARATDEMRLRMARAEALAEELFILAIMGDDRAVTQTYIAGRPSKT